MCFIRVFRKNAAVFYAPEGGGAACVQFGHNDEGFFKAFGKAGEFCTQYGKNTPYFLFQSEFFLNQFVVFLNDIVRLYIEGLPRLRNFMHNSFDFAAVIGFERQNLPPRTQYGQVRL